MSRSTVSLIAEAARPTLPHLLTPGEVAAALGMSVGHLANLRSMGLGIPYSKIGSAVRYDAKDVAAYVAANRVEVEAA